MPLRARRAGRAGAHRTSRMTFRTCSLTSTTRWAWAACSSVSTRSATARSNYAAAPPCTPITTSLPPPPGPRRCAVSLDPDAIVGPQADGDAARRWLSLGADLVSFGRAHLGNPDLVERLRLWLPLHEADADTYYQGGDSGYLYSAYQHWWPAAARLR